MVYVPLSVIRDAGLSPYNLPDYAKNVFGGMLVFVCSRADCNTFGWCKSILRCKIWTLSLKTVSKILIQTILLEITRS